MTCALRKPCNQLAQYTAAGENIVGLYWVEFVPFTQGNLVKVGARYKDEFARPADLGVWLDWCPFCGENLKRWRDGFVIEDRPQDPKEKYLSSIGRQIDEHRQDTDPPTPEP